VNPDPDRVILALPRPGQATGWGEGVLRLRKAQMILSGSDMARCCMVVFLSLATPASPPVSEVPLQPGT